MNAGDISIRVTAELEQFDRDMAVTVARARAAGTEAGSRFTSEFAKLGETLKSRLQNSLSGISKQVLNPMAFAQAFGDGIVTAIKTGNIAQAYVDMVQSLPIVGSFATQMISIYDELTGELSRQAEREVLARSEAARQRRENKAQGERVKAAEELAAKEKAKAEEVDALRKSMLDTQADLNSALSKRAGDEERAIAFQIDRENQRLYEMERAALVGATDEQKKSIYEVFALRRKLNVEEGSQRINKIASEKREEEKAAKEEAERKAELEQERLRKEAEDREKMLEDLRKKEIQLEEDRLAAQIGGISEAQTALGTFKFDAYPATAKKANDERIVKALEDIRTQQRQTAGGFS